MKAAQLTKFNSPLKITPVTLPHLSPKEVAVQVHFAGINFYELMLVAGQYPLLPSLPIIPGGELAGKVIKVGSKVRDFKKGDRVFSLAQTGQGTTGSYAEIAHVEEKYLYHLPDFLSYRIGASFPMIGFTAYTMLTKRVTLPHSGKVLIHSGAGGVGSTLIQLTRALSPKVNIIATCSGGEKEKLVRKLGADLVINTKKRSFVEQLRKEFTDGLDIIFDPLGQEFFEDNLSLLKPMKGIICCYGTYTGAITDPNVVGKLRKNNLTLSGFLMWLLLEDKEFCQKIFRDLFKLIKLKKFMPVVDRVFPLKKINEAHQRIRERKNIGKVLLRCIA